MITFILAKPLLFFMKHIHKVTLTDPEGWEGVGIIRVTNLFFYAETKEKKRKKRKKDSLQTHENT